MITGELKSKIDKIWSTIWTGGIANPLTDQFKEPGNKKKSVAKLLHEDDIIGYIVRTRTNVNPAFLLAGHKINHKQVVDVALRSSPRYKIPEPTRQAHLLVNVNEYRRSKKF